MRQYKRRRTVTSYARRQAVPRSLGNPLLLTAETKYFDTERTVNNISSLASGITWSGAAVNPTTINCLCAPTQGSGFNNREGRKICVMAIRIKAMWSWSGIDFNNVLNGDIGRMVLYIDKQNNGQASSNPADVIQSGTAATDPTLMEFRNPANFGRFIILKDKIITRPGWNTAPKPGSATNNWSYGNITKVKWDIVLKNPLIMHFNATNGGTCADIVDNSIFLAAADFNGLVANQLFYKCRVAFKDP